MNRRRLMMASKKKGILPSGYTLLDYIESTGTQYINTGFIPNQDTRVVCDFQFTVAPSGREHWGVFGGRDYTSVTNKHYAFGYTSKAFRTDYNTTRSFYKANAFDAIGRHIVDMNKNITSLDGTLITHTYTEFNTGYQIVLFGISTTGNVTNLSKLRLYSCQIYDNNVLVRDFKPCINPDGDVGMYDTVGKMFYSNAGTDTFIDGPAT